MEVEQTFTKTLKRTNDFMNHLRFEIASRFFALLLIWRSLRWLPNVFLDFTKKKKKRKKQSIDFLITVPTGTEFSANIIMVTAPGHWQGLQ